MDKAYKRALQKIEHAYATGATELDLSDNKMSSFLSEIGKLVNLTELDLDFNPLSSLPPIEKLVNLTELDLSYNQLSSLPPEIGKLQNLTKLSLSFNPLSSLPPEITKLQKLTKLYLSYNQLSSFLSEIGKLVNLTWLSLSYNQLSSLPPEIGKLQKLTKLDFRSNQLSSLPPEIGKLQNLTSLNLGSNHLSSLPPEIGKLQNLTWLSLSYNHLSSLPPEIGKLQNLTKLNLGSNHLSSLPKEIGLLTELQRLVLYSNQLSNIPNSLKNLKKLESNTSSFAEWRGLPLHNNQFGFPEEVYKKPPQELVQYILDWQKAKEKKPLHEAKVIVIGTGGVGKTSLVNMITKGHYNRDELKTEGIEITDWKIKRGEDTIDLHIWDFGGQEIMHATHKFFMTKRSIYVLVTNPRTEDRYGDTDIDYWMKLIQSYAGKEVPVIIAINKCDIHTIDVGKGTLRDRYGQLVEIVETSCEKKMGIEALKDAIQKSIKALPHIDDTLPLTYFDIKNRLVRTNKEYIAYHAYRDVCRKVDEEFEELSMKVLMGLLHDLGIMLNFCDTEEGEEIAQTQVLNPEWVTKGVYAVINAKRLIGQGGKVSYKDFREILPAEGYPTEKERKLIRMVMRRFELAYKLPFESAYIVPGALPKDKPGLDIAEGQVLRIRFVYETMPSSIMSRFIVHTHDLLVGNQLWRDGIVLEHQGCQAYVYAVPEDEEMYIEVRGEGQRRYMLAVLLRHLEQIHGSLAEIGAEKEVYVEKHSKGKLRSDWVSYEHLVNAERDGEKEIYVSKLRGRIRVKEVLNGFRQHRPIVERDKKVKVVFFASSPEDASRLRVDEEYREITGAQQLSSYRDCFQWKYCGAVRTEDLRRSILQDRPKIVHFAGHGKIGLHSAHEHAKRIEEAGILLEDNEGWKRFVGGERLKELFKVFEGRVECVCLNCCYSSGVAEVLLPYVPYIIAVKQAVEDRHAVLFATAFYEGLGEGEGVEWSFDYAKGAEGLEGMGEDMFELFVRGR